MLCYVMFVTNETVGFRTLSPLLFFRNGRLLIDALDV
jgi:hypothetical protein